MRGGTPSPDDYHVPRCASGLPGFLQWPGAMSSLTVARQRGICTRFPVLLVREERANLFQKARRIYLRKAAKSNIGL